MRARRGTVPVSYPTDSDANHFRQGHRFMLTPSLLRLLVRSTQIVGLEMSQHFLLSKNARSLSLARVARMSDEEARDAFKQIRWAPAGRPHGQALSPSGTPPASSPKPRPLPAMPSPVEPPRSNPRGDGRLQGQLYRLRMEMRCHPVSSGLRNEFHQCHLYPIMIIAMLNYAPQMLMLYRPKISRPMLKGRIPGSYSSPLKAEHRSSRGALHS